jgi:hypothetical protein
VVPEVKILPKSGACRAMSLFLGRQKSYESENEGVDWRAQFNQ